MCDFIAQLVEHRTRIVELKLKYSFVYFDEINFQAFMGYIKNCFIISLVIVYKLMMEYILANVVKCGCKVF